MLGSHPKKLKTRAKNRKTKRVCQRLLEMVAENLRDSMHLRPYWVCSYGNLQFFRVRTQVAQLPFEAGFTWSTISKALVLVFVQTKNIADGSGRSQDGPSL
jgi:hypothetical protein